MAMDLNTVSDEMFKMVANDQGAKKYKPGDLFDAMLKKYKSEGLSKKDCKSAIRKLIDEEKLVYTYYGGTFVEVPHIEGSAMAAEAAKK
ncbi:hypothetical protein KJ966_13530 [bacterium]|nr:hypothetical protein [bacterium]